VHERTIVNDDSQETLVRDSEPAESEKSAGSSEKSAGSTHISDSSHTHSIPPAISPEGRKRKRPTDEEDSGTSKLAEPAAEESSHEQPMDFDPFGTTVDLRSKFLLLLGASC
jgi:hypothetical protein